MRLRITSVDHNPPELDEQVPFTLEILRRLPGPKRDEHCLGRLDRPLAWLKNGVEIEIDHLVLWARWQDTRIEPGIMGLPVGIAYVVDQTQLRDARFNMSKCEYVAIGTATDIRWRQFLLRDAIANISRRFGAG